jgi:WD40 repeat protein
MLAFTDSLEVKLVDARTGADVRRFTTYSGRFSVPSFSPDGALLAAAADSHNVSVWEVATSSLIRTLTVRGEYAIVKDIAFSPDGTLLVAGTNDGTVQVWTTVPLQGGT